jgi:malate dehydrogenase (quinone)
MIDVIGRCYKEEMKTSEWQAKFKEMIPSYGQELNKNPELLEKSRALTADILQLK